MVLYAICLKHSGAIYWYDFLLQNRMSKGRAYCLVSIGVSLRDKWSIRTNLTYVFCVALPCQLWVGAYMLKPRSFTSYCWFCIISGANQPKTHIITWVLLSFKASPLSANHSLAEDNLCSALSLFRSASAWLKVVSCANISRSPSWSIYFFHSFVSIIVRLVACKPPTLLYLWHRPQNEKNNYKTESYNLSSTATQKLRLPGQECI